MVDKQSVDRTDVALRERAHHRLTLEDGRVEPLDRHDRSICRTCIFTGTIRERAKTKIVGCCAPCSYHKVAGVPRSTKYGVFGSQIHTEP